MIQLRGEAMRCSVLISILLLVGRTSFAQQVIQQPVVATTAVSTTVSVPDRGSALLGGVSSAQSGRAQYGPLRSGTNTGISRQATSITTHVYIHDLQAMDEAILNSGTSESTASKSSIVRTLVRSKDREQPVDPIASPAEKAAKFEQLAKKADEAGKYG
ncbi:MAG: hypothetical protein WCH39_17470, partial [Schlesneria sp.]